MSRDWQYGKFELWRARIFAMFFFCMAVLGALYFLWTVTTGGESTRSDIYEEIQRGANVLIFAYITYAIHNDIRSQIRYGRDQPLYDAVEKKMEASSSDSMREVDSDMDTDDRFFLFDAPVVEVEEGENVIGDEKDYR